jgi:hypothetical protein
MTDAHTSIPGDAGATDPPKTKGDAFLIAAKDTIAYAKKAQCTTFAVVPTVFATIKILRIGEHGERMTQPFVWSADENTAYVIVPPSDTPVEFEARMTAPWCMDADAIVHTADGSIRGAFSANRGKMVVITCTEDNKKHENFRITPGAQVAAADKAKLVKKGGFDYFSLEITAGTRNYSYPTHHYDRHGFHAKTHDEDGYRVKAYERGGYAALGEASTPDTGVVGSGRDSDIKYHTTHYLEQVLADATVTLVFAFDAEMGRAPIVDPKFF